MKYTTEIIVKEPRDEFIKKILNYSNYKHWQEGLENFEHISGDPGTLGAKMKLNYKFGKRKMSLIETITYKNLPEEIHMNYDVKGMNNIQKNYFESTVDNYTKWVSKNQFIPTNFMMRMMILIMPNTFKKQSLKYLTDFKNFAENGKSVLNA